MRCSVALVLALCGLAASARAGADEASVKPTAAPTHGVLEGKLALA